MNADSAEPVFSKRQITGGLVASILLGLSSAVAIAWGMSIVALFLGWAAAHTVTPDRRGLSSGSVSFLIGIVLAMLVPSLVGLLEPWTGKRSLETVIIVVFAVFHLAHARLPFAMVPATLGFAAFFASFLNPGWTAALEILTPGLIGFLNGSFGRWVTAQLPILPATLAGKDGEGNNRPAPDLLPHSVSRT
jgi:hypothetical protein